MRNLPWIFLLPPAVNIGVMFRQQEYDFRI